MLCINFDSVLKFKTHHKNQGCIFVKNYNILDKKIKMVRQIEKYATCMQSENLTC